MHSIIFLYKHGKFPRENIEMNTSTRSHYIHTNSTYTPYHPHRSIVDAFVVNRRRNPPGKLLGGSIDALEELLRALPRAGRDQDHLRASTYTRTHTLLRSRNSYRVNIYIQILADAYIHTYIHTIKIRGSQHNHSPIYII